VITSWNPTSLPSSVGAGRELSQCSGHNASPPSCIEIDLQVSLLASTGRFVFIGELFHSKGHFGRFSDILI